MEGGLYINGEKCPKDTITECAPNTRNILITYDTVSREKSPETISSNSDSDIIILGNSAGGKGLPWSNPRELEQTQFIRSLKGLRTPSPRAIVTQWLQASPTFKLPEKRSIIIERTVEDKQQYDMSSKNQSTFEIFDLGANRLKRTSSAGVSPKTSASPETCRKQELCSYLQLMNMNSKSAKQRTKLRSSFNRRSNRVKNLIVQIEKRKLEEKLSKEIESNIKLVEQTCSLSPNSILNGRIQPLPESAEAGAILQGFTPSLMPINVRKRKVAFDIVMRRFITDEDITIKQKRDSMNTDDERSGIASSAPKRRIQQIKNKPISSDDVRLDRRRLKRGRPQLNVATPIKTSNVAIKNRKIPRRIVKLKAFKRRIKQKIGMTLFEQEIDKVNRLRSSISKHHLRVRTNQLEYKENILNKHKNVDIKSDSIAENVANAKHESDIEHRKNGINNGVKIKQDINKTGRNETNSESPQNSAIIEKQTEIVDLSQNSPKLNKSSKENTPNRHLIRENKKLDLSKNNPFLHEEINFREITEDKLLTKENEAALELSKNRTELYKNSKEENQNQHLIKENKVLLELLKNSPKLDKNTKEENQYQHLTKEIEASLELSKNHLKFNKKSKEETQKHLTESVVSLELFKKGPKEENQKQHLKKENGAPLELSKNHAKFDKKSKEESQNQHVAKENEASSELYKNHSKLHKNSKEENQKHLTEETGASLELSENHVKFNKNSKKESQKQHVSKKNEALLELSKHDSKVQTNSKEQCQNQHLTKENAESLELAKNRLNLDKNLEEINQKPPSIKEIEKSSSNIQKQSSPIRTTIKMERLKKTDKHPCLIDHTYAEISHEDFMVDQENVEVDIPNFNGFTKEQQNVSNRFFQITTTMADVNIDETNTENVTKHADLSNTLQAENAIVESNLNDLNDENNRLLNDDTTDLEPDLSNQLIHYNMHDYTHFDSISNISDNSSTSNEDDSSDSSSIYSDASAEKSSKLIDTANTLTNSILAEKNDLENTTIQESSICAEAQITNKTKSILQAVVEPSLRETAAMDTNKVFVIETDPPLQFIPRSNPTYIPLINQNKLPSRTLHRNLTNNNNSIRRKAPILDSPSASYQHDNVSTSKVPNPSDSNHCATLSPSNGRLLHAEYCAGQLIASQERLVTCWAQTPLGHILHSQDLWISRGSVARQQFGDDSVLKHMKNRIMIVDNILSYVEIWVKEHRSVFRERPVADVFAVLYLWKTNQIVEKKLIQLENIKGSAFDVQCIILKKSRSVLVSWSIMQSTIKQATVLQLYQLSPDYQRVLTIKELKSIGTKIQSLHTIEDSDDLVIGCGENCINIWNVESGYIVATLDMPDILPEPKCLWTLCNQGFVFLLQECNDGLLRLIAINGMKMKITWKNLKIFHPPQEYHNLLGVSLENGILLACYENGILSWNVQTSELLTEEPLPTDAMAPFSSPSCFLSDSHLVQLERNGQLQVSHVSYHLLTSSDLSM